MLRITPFAIQRGIGVRNDTGHCDTIDLLTNDEAGGLGRGGWADDFALGTSVHHFHRERQEVLQ
ncbi:hypothetical protein GCM10023156_39240 [Novipirellula rosea]|uniref:Uncharacterized protein n=1 Tax=Novipirellula rosea TaxID=1031540 RepID=A0ABP8N5A2_9BACT